MSSADCREADSTHLSSSLEAGEVSSLGHWGIVKSWKEVRTQEDRRSGGRKLMGEASAMVHLRSV